jgi:Secretion system C-terminal sorting domain
MKKIILLAILALSGIAQAQQIKVNRPGGLQLNNGDTFVTNSVETPQQNINGSNKLRFTVTNLTEESMRVGIKVKSVSDNVDGTNVQLCFDICVYDIQPDLLLTGVEIDGGATTLSSEDHFWSFNAGTGGPVTYQLAFVKLDGNEDDGYTVVEELLNFNYVYDATAGVSNFDGLKQMGVTVENTVVKNSLNLTAAQNASLQLFDTTGKLIKTTAVKSGAQAIDLSALTTGIYMAKFTTVDNKTAAIKVVKN